MHQCRDVVGQRLLGKALVGGCAVALIQFLDAPTAEESEDFEAFDDITIIGVEPKLIHRKGACEIAIQPNGVALGFPKLGPITIGNQWSSQSVNRNAKSFMDQIGPAGEVAPLIRAAGL